MGRHLWCGLQRSPLLSGAPRQGPKGLHCSSATHKSDSSLVPQPPEPLQKPAKALSPYEELFRQAPDTAWDKASFVRAMQNFGQHNVYKRGHMDLLYLALRNIREYSANRDLVIYNLLLDIFPKEVFRSRTIFQKLFTHYHSSRSVGLLSWSRWRTTG